VGRRREFDLADVVSVDSGLRPDDRLSSSRATRVKVEKSGSRFAFWINPKLMNEDYRFEQVLSSLPQEQERRSKLTAFRSSKLYITTVVILSCLMPIFALLWVLGIVYPSLVPPFFGHAGWFPAIWFTWLSVPMLQQYKRSAASVEMGEDTVVFKYFYGRTVTANKGDILSVRLLVISGTDWAEVGLRDGTKLMIPPELPDSLVLVEKLRALECSGV
jgi:hypothetical protein